MQDNREVQIPAPPLNLTCHMACLSFSFLLGKGEHVVRVRRHHVYGVLYVTPVEYKVPKNRSP